VFNYLDSIDSFQNVSPDPDMNYTLNADSLSIIFKTLPMALIELSKLSYQAKQERVVILDRDSNLIILTHKYFGLDEEDLNIERFRLVNNIKNRRVFNIKKGAQIKYFV